MAIDGEANEREAEVARVMQICNACRYCETYCAVFPAMTRRLQFDAATTHYLANLCHNCGACLHACQYAAPHPFAVNVPRSMAKVRGITYQQYAWPRAFGALYHRNGLVVALALATGISLFILLLLALDGHLLGGAFGSNFYAIYPHEMLVQVFGVTFGWAAIALGVGVSRFWRDQAPGGATAVPVAEAVGNILKLTYLAGGHGEGCNERDDRYTLARRVLHHFTFYGFLSCGAATVVATFYHYVLGLHAPYALSSLPVLLGTLGGIGLLLGPAGLLWLNLQRHPLHGDPEQKPMDRAFIALLLLASASGLALLAWRSTPAMAALLAIHLGCIIALFATLPYGKFAHAVYRSAALLKWSIERRRPNPVTLSAD